MASIKKIGKVAKKELLKKEITIYRLNSFKNKIPREADIKIGAMVRVNGLKEVMGTVFGVENYRCNPQLFYKFESNEA